MAEKSDQDLVEKDLERDEPEQVRKDVTDEPEPPKSVIGDATPTKRG